MLIPDIMGLRCSALACCKPAEPYRMFRVQREKHERKSSEQGGRGAALVTNCSVHKKIELLLGTVIV